MADQIVVLNAGRVEQVGAPMDLYHRPETEFVAGFIGSPAMNILPGASALGEMISAGPEVAKVGIRPEHIQIAAEGLKTTIQVKEQLGGESYLYTRAADDSQIVIKTDGEDSYAAGDAIHLALSADRVHRFAENGQAIR